MAEVNFDVGGVDGDLDACVHLDKIRISVDQPYRDSIAHTMYMNKEDARKFRDWLTEVLD